MKVHGLKQQKNKLKDCNCNLWLLKDALKKLKKSLTYKICNIMSHNDIYSTNILNLKWFVSLQTKNPKTQFEIERRCGGHSVTKKFVKILQILLAKHRFWKKLYCYKQYIFNVKIHFFFC